jgi:hypothetical protein
MVRKLLFAIAVGTILFAPTALLAQGVGGAVNAGATVRGAAVQGDPEGPRSFELVLLP